MMSGRLIVDVKACLYFSGQGLQARPSSVEAVAAISWWRYHPLNKWQMYCPSTGLVGTALMLHKPCNTVSVDFTNLVLTFTLTVIVN